jgi:kynurenine formamidase
MANLAAVPPRGAIIVVAWPKPRDGTGFPARCFAVAPR